MHYVAVCCSVAACIGSALRCDARAMHVRCQRMCSGMRIKTCNETDFSRTMTRTSLIRSHVSCVMSHDFWDISHDSWVMSHDHSWVTSRRRKRSIRANVPAQQPPTPLIHMNVVTHVNMLHAANIFVTCTHRHGSCAEHHQIVGAISWKEPRKGT